MSGKKLALLFVVIAVLTFVVTFFTAKFQNTGILLVWLLVLAVAFGWRIVWAKKKANN
ncbi:hypothetical protein [Kurthia senegalensis]|uniref:hypothetical protein n=1 Tax=Kurthia senegalensis TaxID=1033740 RepID=UPI00030A8613|nr:hypothetical protein [Kurthia senegalensis]